MDVGTADVIDVEDGTTVDTEEVMIVVDEACNEEEVVVAPTVVDGVQVELELLVGVGAVELEVVMSLL